MRTDLPLTPRTMQRFSLVALVFLAACSSKSATTEITTRDSAGVTIIEHPAGAIAAAPAWTLGPATLTIAHGASEEGFGRIDAANRLADGRILVSDNAGERTTLLLFSADGTFERQLGRSGSGPGEFQFAQILRVAGDTLVLYDPFQMRRTLLLTSGTLVATNDLSRLGPMAVGQPTGALDDGRLLSTPFNFGDTGSSSGGHFRRVSVVLLVDPVAPASDTASTTIPGDESYMMSLSLGGRTRSFPNPVGYGARTFFATSGNEVYVAANTTNSIDRYGSPWRLTRSVRFAEGRRPVDQAAKDAMIAAALANLEETRGATPEMKEQFKDVIRRAEFADSMGWYSELKIAEGGALWLRELRSRADSVPHYVIVGPDGHLAARTALPLGATLLWASADQALIVMRDEDDIERIELRAILKSGSAQ